MSDTAAQPWWAEVQHLRPRDAGGPRERRESVAPAGGSGSLFESPIVGDAVPAHTARFARSAVIESPLETAVAVAIADELPRLDDIDWHDFIDSHAELDDVVGGDVGLDVAWDDEPRREATSGRRTVEIHGRADRATATIDPQLAAEMRESRRRAPATAAERFQARPDRVALWAFLLGVVLILVAALSAPEADAAVRLLAG